MYSGIHLNKDQPAQSYVIVKAKSPLGDQSVYVNKTAIPNVGGFEEVPIHTDATGSGVARFSEAPQGNVIYCNGIESLIWGGEEHRCAGFINYAPDGSFSYDYSEQISNIQEDAQNVAVLHTVTGGADDDTKLLLHFDNNVTDFSTTPHTVTNNNVTFSSSVKVFGTHSSFFNGTTAYLTIPDHADFNFSGGIFTIDTRFRSTTTLANTNSFFYQSTYIESVAFTLGTEEISAGSTITGKVSGKTAIVDYVDVTSGTWAGNDAAGIIYVHTVSGVFQNEIIQVGAVDSATIAGDFSFKGRNYIDCFINSLGALWVVVFECYGAGSSVAVYTPNSTIAASTQYHIQIVENGDNWYIFVNGILKGQSSDSGRAKNYIGLVQIGKNNSEYLDGYLDEYRISNIARNTSDFEPPSEAYSEDSASTYFNVGATRQLQAIKLYVKVPNNETSVCSGYYWNGSQYVQVSSLVDGTAVDGKSLAQTGTISFTSTVDIAQVKYYNGLILYWYKFYISQVFAGVEISYVTIDAPMQSIKNIWSGNYDIVASCKKWDGNKFIDYTLEVNDTITTTAAILDGLTTSQYLLLGFVNRQQAFQFNFVSEKSNTTEADLTCYYNDGEGYVSVGSYSDWDGTSKNNTSFTQDGVVSFKHLGRNEEFRQVIDGAGPFYYYKLQFSATLSAEVEVFFIRGIQNPGIIESHDFAIEFQNRVLLCSGTNPESVKISASNSPDVYNGDDFVELFFGKASKFIAGVGVYNRFGSSIYNFAILCKLSETWILDGYSPDTFKQKQISNTSGCCAPQTMKTCNIGKVAGDEIPKNIVIWLSFDGPVYCDGGGVFPLKGVEPYFDPNDSRCINYDYIDKACSEYDYINKTYNLNIPSGSGQTTNNVWLFYDIHRNKWSKKVVPTYPTCMFAVTDTKGAKYTYMGFASGYLMRDEHGTTFDGTGITQTIVFADLLLTDSAWEDIRIDFLKLICKAKNTGAQVSISAYHRANGDSSWTALTNVPMWDTGKRVVKHLQRLNKIGVGHEIKFEVTTTDKADGCEPLMMGLLYHPERIDLTLGLGK